MQALKPSVVVLGSILATIALAIPVHAQIFNITSDASPILGLNNTGSYGTLGIEIQNDTVPYEPDGLGFYLTDGNVNTHNSTFYFSGYLDVNGNPVTTVYDSSFVGVLNTTGSFATLTTTKAVTALTVVFDVAANGGWFGVNGDNTVATDSDLVLPTLQITTDKGASWTDIGYTSNYEAVVAGGSPGEGNAPVVTFTLDTPQADIDGIRLIGTHGGLSSSGGGSLGNGFVAVSELVVDAETIPEPSAWALIGVGGLFMVWLLRRRSAKFQV